MTTSYILMPVGNEIVKVKVEPPVTNGTTQKSGLEELGLKEKIEEVAGELIVEAPNAFCNLTNTISALSNGLWEQLDELGEKVKPEEMSVEFGLSLNLKGDVAIVEIGGEASFKVTLTWQPKKNSEKSTKSKSK